MNNNIDDIMTEVINDLIKNKKNKEEKRVPPGYNKYERNREKKEEDEEEDVWNRAIEDDKFMRIAKIKKIFPVIKPEEKMEGIKIDEDSYNYITIKDIADTISKIICYHLIKMNINPRRVKIADYTAGVGGNVISFCKYFGRVYCIEIDKMRSEYLENNIKLYEYDNYEIINGDAIKFNEERMIKDNIDVIFIDPPWGGSIYKYSDNLRLKLGEMYIEEIVVDIYNKFVNNNVNNMNNKIIVIKLPKNYDIEYFYNFIKTNNNKNNNYTIYSTLYIMNKMMIIVCEIMKYYL